MYSLPPRQRQLGLGHANGISTYFSANCEEEDAAIAARFLTSLSLSPYVIPSPGALSKPKLRAHALCTSLERATCIFIPA